MNAYHITGDYVTTDETPDSYLQYIEDEEFVLYINLLNMRVLARDETAALQSVAEQLKQEHAWFMASDGDDLYFWADFTAEGCPGWQIELCGDDVAAALLGHPRLPLAL